MILTKRRRHFECVMFTAHVKGDSFDHNNIQLSTEAKVVLSVSSRALFNQGY